MKKVEPNLMRTLSTKRACWISFLPQNGVNCLLYIILSVTTWRTLKFLRISSKVQLLIDQQLHSIICVDLAITFELSTSEILSDSTCSIRQDSLTRKSLAHLCSRGIFDLIWYRYGCAYHIPKAIKSVDLTKCVQVQLEEEPFANAPVDNYCKFYLRCFVRRIWPLLAQVWLLCSLDTNSNWLDSFKCRP